MSTRDLVSEKKDDKIDGLSLTPFTKYSSHTLTRAELTKNGIKTYSAK